MSFHAAVVEDVVLSRLQIAEQPEQILRSARPFLCPGGLPCRPEGAAHHDLQALRRPAEILRDVSERGVEHLSQVIEKRNKLRCLYGLSSDSCIEYSVIRAKFAILISFYICIMFEK